MAKRPWNIWNIKNRWVRAMVAWPLVLVLLVVAAVGLPVLAIIFAFVGAYRGIRDEFAGVMRTGGWIDLGRHAWKAMTARESA